MQSTLFEKDSLRFVPCRSQRGCGTRSAQRVNSDAHVVGIYDSIFSVPAGTEFCEAAVKWKSVADFYPQGVRGIRKAAKLPTAAQDCRARRQIMLNLFWRDRK